MKLPRTGGSLATGLSGLFAAAVLLPGLSAFGIWDPWELEAADAARRLTAGHGGDAPPAPVWLAAAGFRLLGVHEWSGRLPIALAGGGALIFLYAFVRRFAGPRAAVLSVLVTVTTPLFIFNARPMLGAAPLFAVQILIAWQATVAVFGVEHAFNRGRATFAWLIGTAAACALGLVLGGALTCVLPPLGAVALAALVEGRLTQPGNRAGTAAAWTVVVGAAALAALTALAIIGDETGHSVFTGGQPVSTQPPTFDALIERIFHGFAPWSAVLPLAFAHMALAPTEREDGHGGASEAPLRLVLIGWAALGYAAHTLFLARHGTATAYLPVGALGTLVALWLADTETRRQGNWPAAITALCLSGLVVRDFALYPGAPVSGMPLANFEVPEVFNPRSAWAVAVGAFGAAAFFGLGLGAARRPLGLAAPYRFLRTQWQRGPGARVWLASLTLLCVALLVLGALARLAPETLKLSTLARRALGGTGLVPLAVPVLLIAFQVAAFGFARLGRRRLWPLVAGAAAVGLYASHGYLPALSAHFSPREVYESFNALADDGTELGEFRVGGRAAAYYAKGPVREFEQIGELVDYLDSDDVRWAAFPADELGRLNRMFRNRRKHHLFVADARSARVVLASNRPVAGRENQNALAESVLPEAPTVQYPVNAVLDDRIKFLGYDLKLPQGEHVGAGEKFEVVWYFECLKNVSGNYKMFVHIDGDGQRIHGDHHPVDDEYPVRMWDEGDIIRDRQQLDVAANMRPGDYTIYVGFYLGETRMEVVSGPKDDANRIRAGVLRVR